MPICRRSGADVRVICISAMTIWGLVFPIVAYAQSAGDGAKAKIEAEGNASLDRLQTAISKNKQRAQAGDRSSGSQANPAMRQRAFEALRRRASSPAMDARARAAVETGRADVVLERDAMARRLGQALGLEAPDTAAIAKAAEAPVANAWVPVLFASSSIPIGILRTYAAQLEKVHGVIAFRGMPGGLMKVGPMAKLSAQILRIDPGCEGPACAMRDVQLIVDPIIFRQHGITSVPALAMVPGDPTQPYCERDDESPRAQHVVSGDAALSGLLEEYARLGGKKEVRDAQSRLEPR
jgi:hypothetical protein